MLSAQGSCARKMQGSEGRRGWGQKDIMETSLSRTWVGTEVTASSLVVELWGTWSVEDGKRAGHMGVVMGVYLGVSFTWSAGWISPAGTPRAAAETHQQVSPCAGTCERAGVQGRG